MCDDLKINSCHYFKCEKCKKIPLIKMKYFKEQIIKIVTKCINNHILNYSLKEFLHKVKNENNNNNKKLCDICLSIINENNKLYYCNICNVFICEKCIIEHLKINSNHLFIDKNNINKTCDNCFKLGQYFCYDCVKNICDSCYDKEKQLNHNIKIINELIITSDKIEEIYVSLSKAINYLKYIELIKNDSFKEKEMNLELKTIYDSFIEVNKFEIELIINLLEMYKCEKKSGLINNITYANLTNIINFNDFNKSINKCISFFGLNNIEIINFFTNKNNFILNCEEENEKPIIKCIYNKENEEQLKFFLSLRNDILLNYENKMTFDIRPSFNIPFSLSAIFNNKKIDILTKFEDSKNIKKEVLNQLNNIYNKFYKTKFQNNDNI